MSPAPSVPIKYSRSAFDRVDSTSLPLAHCAMFATVQQRLVDTTSGLGRLIVQLPGDAYNIAGDFAASAKKGKIRYRLSRSHTTYKLTMYDTASGMTL